MACLLVGLGRLPPGQEIEPRQLSPHPTDRIGAKCLLLTQRVDAIEKIIKHHGDHLQVLEKMHKLCLAVDQDGMKVEPAPFPPPRPPVCPDDDDHRECFRAQRRCGAELIRLSLLAVNVTDRRDAG